MRIHLDTDLGSDTDDACALALLLGWPGVELVGITTSIDPGGRRAGYVSHCLELAGRTDIPVAAGAEVSLTTLRVPGSIPEGERYWPTPVQPRPSPPGAALDLLQASVEQQATVVAVGPYTNLALLAVTRPASLAGVPVVVMGGWAVQPDAGLPAYGAERDWNVQCDPLAARILAAAADRLTLVPLAVTLRTWLRTEDLPELRAAGPLGDLLATQAQAHAQDHGMAALAHDHDGLPDDLLNFQHDSLACVVAAGWPGAEVREMRLELVSDGDVLRFEPSDRGRPTRVVTDVDGPGFSRAWLAAATNASDRPARG